MSEFLPVYDFPEIEGAPTYQLGLFENIFDEAKKRGVVSAVPNNKEETFAVESQQIRIQTIASRLWLLGYLPEKIKPNDIEKNKEKIKKAVFRFQGDAGLKQDFWVGNKTWHALDELVSYESHYTYDKWFVNDQIIPESFVAVQRATQLRLWSLGLYPEPPKENFNLLNKDVFKDFEKVLHLISIKFDTSKIDFNFYTLSILFNQDAFSIAIGSSKYPKRDAFNFNVKVAINSTVGKDDLVALKELARKFVVNCARIELWLLGFEVEIGAKVSNRLMRRMTTKKKGNLRKELTRYYQFFVGHDISLAENLSNRISPKFFQGISDANKMSDDNDLDDVSEEIVDRITDTNKVSEAWNYLKNKGMRLWDGIKRIWRWVKKKSKEVVDFIKNNIFKAFFRYVAKAYKIVASGITKVVESLKVYAKGVMNSENIIFTFSKDMDTQSFLANKATSEDVKIGIEKLRNQTKAFNLGCRIIGVLFKILKEAVKGYIGWAKLLIALLKSYKKIKILYIDFKTVALS